jgi:hypothetical protein
MNGQILVFNTRLSLFEAINALAEQNIFCGVLWDEDKKVFVDIFTIRDIMEILTIITEQLESHFPGIVHTISPKDPAFISKFSEILAQVVENPQSQPMEIPGKEKQMEQQSSPAAEEAAKIGYEVIYGLLKNIKLGEWATISNKLVRKLQYLIDQIQT